MLRRKTHVLYIWFIRWQKRHSLEDTDVLQSCSWVRRMERNFSERKEQCLEWGVKRCTGSYFSVWDSQVETTCVKDFAEVTANCKTNAGVRHGNQTVRSPREGWGHPAMDKHCVKPHSLQGQPSTLSEPRDIVPPCLARAVLSYFLLHGRKPFYNLPTWG